MCHMPITYSQPLETVTAGVLPPQPVTLACAVPIPAEFVTPIGYQGAAQHTYTTVCDGFHEPGQCPRSVH